MIEAEATVQETPSVESIVESIRFTLRDLGQTEDALVAGLRNRGIDSLDALNAEQATSLLARLQEKLQVLSASV